MLAVDIDRGRDDCEMLRFRTLLESVVDVIEKLLSALDREWDEDEGLK